MKLLYRISILSLGFFATATPWLRAQSKVVGIVVGITGQWERVNPSKFGPHHPDPKLHFGDSIGLSSCVAGDGGALTVEFDTPPTVFACEGKPDPPCEQPIGKKCARLIALPAEKSWAVSLAEEFHAIFSEPDRYVTPVARGLEPHLADGVAALQDGHLDFAPAFAEMDSGTYRVRFEPLGEEKPSSIVQIEWTGKGPASSAVPGIRPGLYRLTRLNAQSEPAEPGAWVLVDGPDYFSQDSASFRSAEEETKAWPDDVDARVPRAVLRAYLDSLARHAHPGP